MLKLCSKNSQRGAAGMGILGALLSVLVIFLVLGYTIPTIWPLISNNASSQISAMTGTDTGTVVLKALFPIAVLLVGIGLVAAIIMYAVKQFRAGV